jgi:hypothetical protein
MLSIVILKKVFYQYIGPYWNLLYKSNPLVRIVKSYNKIAII